MNAAQNCARGLTRDKELILIVALFSRILRHGLRGHVWIEGPHDIVREHEQRMRNGLTVLAVVCALFCAPLAHAQESLASKLLADALGNVRSGTYLAGDSVKFTIDDYGNKYLLRIVGDPEVYVLYPNRASLGGRELKYDSGATAISVAGWGGMTLYTDAKPGGLPASRTGDSTTPALAPANMPDMQNAAQDEEQHLNYARKLRINVEVDWNEIASNPRERAQAFDAMENAVRGIDRFSLTPQGRAAFTAKIDTMKIILTGSRPTATISGRTLVVSYNKNQGFAGRASSRGIARALGLLLGIKGAN